MGYGLADPDFRFLFDQVARRQFARIAYAVWPGLPADERALWRDQGVVILEQEPLAFLSTLVSGDDAPDSAVEEAISLTGDKVESGHLSWDKVTIRRLLTVAFSDVELTTFCFDHYADVYENFSDGMTKSAKIQQLLDYCFRHNAVDTLLELVAQYNPGQYSQFATGRSFD